MLDRFNVDEICVEVQLFPVKDDDDDCHDDDDDNNLQLI
jgi:hypothetical protein